jgi:methionine-S-sulfoxide reductase
MSTTPAGSASPLATAVLAGGCFWCTEAAFEQLAGVVDVTSGYAGGSAATANYRAVCGGNTGHAEVIRITYDPGRISYSELLDVFFDAHDPTQLNRQGNDVGTQYRSAIFYADEAEKAAAAARIAELTDRRAFGGPIVTTLEPLVEFFPAEDYHQDYARLNPEQPYIQAVSLPKVCKVRAKHAALLK